MTARESSGNLPSTQYQNVPSPSELSTATLEEENAADTEPDTDHPSEEPEASGSNYAVFTKPPSIQKKSQSLPKTLNKNDYDSQFSKRQKLNTYDLQALEIEKRKINLMEQRFSRPTINYQDDEDYAFFMSLLPSVKKLSQIEKMKLRMRIMGDVTDALEAHNFVKEVRSSRVIPSPINSPHMSFQSSPYLSPTDTECSQHSQASSAFILNQASQPGPLPSQELYSTLEL